MTTAKRTKAKGRATERVILAFPKADDWKSIVRDLKLTRAQEKELEITIRHVLADIDSYRAVESKKPPRDILVAALKRLEKALGRVQSEMARSEDLMNHYLSSNTLEFIGKSFTFTAMKMAVTNGVFTIRLDNDLTQMIEESRSITVTDLEECCCNERIALAYRHGGEILKNFIDVIYTELNSWVEMDKKNKGGRPANNFRRHIIQRLAQRSSLIVGKRATTTAKGRFVELCIAVLPACGFRSKGIEKAIEAVLGKRNSW
jgi:hypothetical protein